MKHFVFLKTFLLISVFFLNCGPEEQTDQASPQGSTGEPTPSQISTNVISPEEIDDLWNSGSRPTSATPSSWAGPPSFTVTSRPQGSSINTPGGNNSGQRQPSSSTSPRATGGEARPTTERGRQAADREPFNDPSNVASPRRAAWRGVKTIYHCRTGSGNRTYITYEPGRVYAATPCEFDAVQPRRGQCQNRINQGWRIFDPNEDCDHPVDFIDCREAWQILGINPDRICTFNRMEYNSNEEDPLRSSSSRTQQNERPQERAQQPAERQVRTSPTERGSNNPPLEEEIRQESPPRWSIEEPTASAPHPHP